MVTKRKDLVCDFALRLIDRFQLTGDTWRWNDEWLFLESDDQDEMRKALQRAIDEFVWSRSIVEVRQHLGSTSHDVFKAACLVDDTDIFDRGWNHDDFLRNCLDATIFVAVRDILSPHNKDTYSY